jgi:Flp pilus assembly protein TadG
VAVIVAVSLTALMAVAAITLDGGLLLDDRWRAQAAADTAALAAAVDLYQNYSVNQGLDPWHTAQKSALSTAAANGYSNDGATSTVTLNIPPLSGTYLGMPGYAEVVVQFNQPRYFSGIFSLFNANATGAIPVVARSVARGISKGGSGNGIIVLNSTAQKALNVTGPGDVTVKSGPIIVDSNNSNAAVITGSGGVYAPEVDITGSNPGHVAASTGNFVTSPHANNILTGQLPTPDPLANLPVPDPTSLTTQSTKTLNISQTTVLSPGRYIGGIGIAGGNITMLPGIYYIDHGGFSVSNGSVTGTGVMIYNDPTPGSGEKVTITGGNFDLSAPTSGTYQGIVIFQARDAGNVPLAITGAGTSQMIGTVYASSSPVAVTGAGGATIGSQFISDTLTVTGAGPFTVDWAGHPAPPGQRDMRIVE